MKKLLIIPLLALCSCKTSKTNCDAYGTVTVCDTLVFEAMHIHERINNRPICYEFPSDTLEIDRELCILK